MDNIDDLLTQLAIRHGLKKYGLYFETVDTNDDERVEQIRRLGRAAGDELGVEVAVAPTQRADAGVQVCVWVAMAPVHSAPAA
jgi:hypothetical protein